MARKTVLAVLGFLAWSCGGDDSGQSSDLPGDSSRPSCVSATDCDDGDACTLNRCIAGRCDFAPIVCDDQDPCTTDSCEAGRCVFQPVLGCCTRDNQCDDGNFCTPDRCVDHRCQSDAPVTGCCNQDQECDDGNDCTSDYCVRHACTHYPNASAGCCAVDKDCADGNPCTVDRCVDGHCSYTNAGCCVRDSDCTSEDPCETGSCESNGKCQFTRTPGCCVKDQDCPAVTCTTWTCKQGRCDYAAIAGCCAKDEDCKDACLRCEIPFQADRGECVVKATPECCRTVLLDVSFSDLAGFTIEGMPGGGYAASPRWVIDGQKAHSPASSLYFGDPATHTYESAGGSKVGGRAVSPTVELDRTVQPVLTFWLWKDTDFTPSTDILSVLVRDGSGSERVAWSTLNEIRPITDGAWKQVTVPLAAFQGGPARLIFQFDSVDAFPSSYEGTYIDDLHLEGQCP